MYSERLLEHLSLLDKENEYHCLVQPDYGRSPALGENFRLIRYNSPPVSLNTVLKLHRLLKKEKPDFFHSLFPLAPIFFRGELLVTVHDLQPLVMSEWTGRRIYPVKKIYDLFYRWMYPFTFRRARWLIAVSQATKDILTELFPHLADKVIVVHSGITPEAADPPDPGLFETLKQKFDLPMRYILYVGSTRPNKNVPTMLRAFNRLGELGSEYRDVGFVLILTTDRFFAEILEVIKETKLEPKVRILKPVGQAEKRALYHNAQLLFFATKLEGFGFPLLEAQAQQTPVVASNFHSLPEIAGDSALLVDPDDVEAMAHSLAHVLSNENLRKKLVEAGQKNIQNFSWEKTAHKVLEIYHHLM